MPYLTNIYLLTDQVALKGRTDCVSFAATFRILIRLNLKAPPFEREHIFTCNVQWTCFTVLDLFQINALFFCALTKLSFHGYTERTSDV
jgi:hypothetical protein